MIRFKLQKTLFVPITPGGFFNKVDVYHIHGHFGLYIYIFKLIFGWLDKTPIVAHFHITAAGRWKEFDKTEKKIKFLTKYVEWPLHTLSDKLAIKLARAYIFVGSEAMDDAINLYKADPAKCNLVESAVDTDLFMPVLAQQKLELRKSMSFNESDKVIVNVGFFTDRKNIHLIVESLKFLSSEYKVMLVGKEDQKYGQLLRGIIKDNNLSDRIKFMGEKTNPQTPPYYQAADIFVLPSSYEGFPKAVLEALSCGTPALASGFKIPQIEGLFEVKEFNSEYLANRIREIVESSVKVDGNAIASKYSWDERARQIEKIYENITRKKV